MPEPQISVPYHSQQEVMSRLRACVAFVGAAWWFQISRAAMEPARFNLRVWFAVAGSAVIVALTVASALLMSSFLTTTMLDREVAVAQEFLQSILATEGYGDRVFAADNGHASSLSD